MATHPYSAYDDELNYFISRIDSCLHESDILENRLQEIIMMNTVVGIAARVEVQQLMLDRSVSKLNLCKEEAEKLKQLVNQENHLIQTEVLSKELKSKIELLSIQVTQTARDFEEVRKQCVAFIRDTLKNR